MGKRKVLIKGGIFFFFFLLCDTDCVSDQTGDNGLDVVGQDDGGELVEASGVNVTTMDKVRYN